MRLKEIIAEIPGRLMLMIIFFSIVGSGTHLFLLTIINYKVSNTTPAFIAQYGITVFAGTMLISVICARILHGRIIDITNELLFKVETSLLDRLRKTDLEKFETFGPDKVYTAIADANNLRSVPDVLINILNSLMIMICALVYISLRSWQGAIFIVAIIAALALVYHKMNVFLKPSWYKLRNQQDAYYRYLRDLLSGFKQVKIDAAKNEGIYATIHANRDDAKQKRIFTSKKQLNNELLGEYSWFFILGVTLFVLPAFFSIQDSQLTAFIVTVIYIVGPIGKLMASINSVNVMQISLERLSRFHHELKGTDVNRNEKDPGMPFEALSIKGLEYQYKNHENNFAIGPVNVEFKAGEIVFIVGGNGSGKSTFLKVMAGLYAPTRGSIFLNGALVDSRDNNMQKQMAAIFSDNHLLSENYGKIDLGNQVLLSDYIERLRLTSVVRYEKFSDLKEWQDQLSSGQKKRLAMILSLMEQKAILILDEWASEQDPHLKKYFYTQFIPYLKSVGKTVIAVTHDDDFYHCADTLIKFDFGRAVVQKTQHTHQPTELSFNS